MLDTHTFLWWDEGVLPTKVSRRIRSAEAVLVSAASAWEIAIKAGLGKIIVGSPFAEAVADYGFDGLPISFPTPSSCVRSRPFIEILSDRMLVAQAIVEGLTILTRDELIRAYAVPCAWA